MCTCPTESKLVSTLLTNYYYYYQKWTISFTNLLQKPLVNLIFGILYVYLRGLFTSGNVYIQGRKKSLVCRLWANKNFTISTANFPGTYFSVNIIVKKSESKHGPDKYKVVSAVLMGVQKNFKLRYVPIFFTTWFGL